ncbi:TPA: 50S ribosomal protein L14 [Candidatus Bipolaricaulota bacterium]|nr:50S ribosomal protein L14 [Candidatus Bipolaricaulota bacterium]
MIQQRTILKVADNSGAREVRCITVLRRGRARGGRIGDIIVGSIQKRLPTSELEKGKVVKGVIVRSREWLRRDDGSYIRFDDNAIVLVNDQLEPLGTRVFGPVARELRAKGMLRIISLASEVL